MQTIDLQFMQYSCRFIPLRFKGSEGVPEFCTKYLSMAYKGKRIYNIYTGQHIVFLQTAEETNGRRLCMQMSYQGNGPEPPVHYHPHQQEVFTVKKGVLCVRMNDKLEYYPEGSMIHVPENTPHAMWNGQQGETVVHWEVQPALRTEYFMENVFGMINNAHTSRKGTLGFLQRIAIAWHFRNEFRLQKLPLSALNLLYHLCLPVLGVLRVRGSYKELMD